MKGNVLDIGAAGFVGGVGLLALSGVFNPEPMTVSQEDRQHVMDFTQRTAAQIESDVLARDFTLTKTYRDARDGLCRRYVQPAPDRKLETCARDYAFSTLKALAETRQAVLAANVR